MALEQKMNTLKMNEPLTEKNGGENCRPIQRLDKMFVCESIYVSEN